MKNLRLVKKDQSYLNVRVIMKQLKVTMMDPRVKVKVIIAPIAVAPVMGATVHKEEDVVVVLVDEHEEEELAYKHEGEELYDMEQWFVDEEGDVKPHLAVGVEHKEEDVHTCQELDM